MVPLAKAVDKTQNEEEQSKSNVSPFWSPFLYMLIEQVDILISKNRALQILYLKHCVYKTT